MNHTLIMKFGGASVSDPSQFNHIADLIISQKKCYRNIAIVVSAMGDTTDQLIGLAKSVNPNPPKREYDMLVSVGERISMSLLAMALAKRNYTAVSFTGSQSGIITCSQHSEARIVEVKPQRLIQAFNQEKLVIVAGFQGVSREGEITTLGRGGSDTTAVALGIALNAEKVEFYKDVAGIYKIDPKCSPNSLPYSHLSFDAALEIVERGAKVLHKRSLELAKKNSLSLHVRSFYSDIYEQFPGTIISQASNSLNFESREPIYENADTDCK